MLCWKYQAKLRVWWLFRIEYSEYTIFLFALTQFHVYVVYGMDVAWI